MLYTLDNRTNLILPGEYTKDVSVNELGNEAYLKTPYVSMVVNLPS